MVLVLATGHVVWDIPDIHQLNVREDELENILTFSNSQLTNGDFWALRRKLDPFKKLAVILTPKTHVLSVIWCMTRQNLLTRSTCERSKENNEKTQRKRKSCKFTILGRRNSRGNHHEFCLVMRCHRHNQLWKYDTLRAFGFVHQESEGRGLIPGVGTMNQVVHPFVVGKLAAVSKQRVTIAEDCER